MSIELRPLTTAVPLSGRRRRTAAHPRAASLGPRATDRPAPTPSDPSRPGDACRPCRTERRCCRAIVQVALRESQRLADAQTCTPKNHHKSSRPQAVRRRASHAHDSHDLLDVRRISRIAPTHIARRAAAVKSRHGHRRPATASSVEKARLLMPTRSRRRGLAATHLATASRPKQKRRPQRQRRARGRCGARQTARSRTLRHDLVDRSARS